MNCNLPRQTVSPVSWVSPLCCGRLAIFDDQLLEVICQLRSKYKGVFVGKTYLHDIILLVYSNP